MILIFFLGSINSIYHENREFKRLKGIKKTDMGDVEEYRIFKLEERAKLFYS